jgi:hypothetical protein
VLDLTAFGYPVQTSAASLLALFPAFPDDRSAPHAVPHDTQATALFGKGFFALLGLAYPFVFGFEQGE